MVGRAVKNGVVPPQVEEVSFFDTSTPFVAGGPFEAFEAQLELVQVNTRTHANGNFGLGLACKIISRTDGQTSPGSYIGAWAWEWITFTNNSSDEWSRVTASKLSRIVGFRAVTELIARVGKDADLFAKLVEQVKLYAPMGGRPGVVHTSWVDREASPNGQWNCIMVPPPRKNTTTTS